MSTASGRSISKAGWFAPLGFLLAGMLFSATQHNLWLDQTALENVLVVAGTGAGIEACFYPLLIDHLSKVPDVLSLHRWHVVVKKLSPNLV